MLQRELKQGRILLGVHTVQTTLDDVVNCLSRAGGAQIQTVPWK
jgi:hypothetical protein